MMCSSRRRIQKCTNLCLKGGDTSACVEQRSLVQFWILVPTLGYFDGRAVLTGKCSVFLVRHELVHVLARCLRTAPFLFWSLLDQLLLVDYRYAIHLLSWLRRGFSSDVISASCITSSVHVSLSSLFFIPGSSISEFHRSLDLDLLVLSHHTAV